MNSNPNPSSTLSAMTDESMSKLPASPSSKIVEEALNEGEYVIPDSIRDEEYWICYRIEGTGDQKTRKVPKRPNVSSGRIRNVDPTDISNATTFDDAMNVVHDSKQLGDAPSLDGVGLLLHEENELVGVDIDDAFDAKTGDVEQWALDVVMHLDSFVEVSPSGTGLHVLAHGSLDNDYQNRDDDLGLELYDCERFFTFTGRSLAECPTTIKRREKAVRSLQRTWLDARVVEDDNESNSILNFASLSTQTDSSSAQTDVTLTEDDEAIIEKACARDDDFRKLWNGRIAQWDNDNSRADMALASKLAYWCHGDEQQMDRIFRKSPLYRSKWDEQRGSTTYGQMTIKKAVRRNGP